MQINVHDLVQQNQPIYVYNNTGEFMEDNKPSTHILTIKYGDGRIQAVTVPKEAAKYPFLLSAVVPPKALAESSDFNNACFRRVLIIADPDAARKVMEQPLPQEVMERAVARFQPQVRVARPMPDVIAGNAPTQPAPDANGPLTLDQIPLHKAASPDTVDPTVRQIVMDVKSDPSIARDKMLALEGLQLSKADYGYVMTECHDISVLVNWARTGLAELVGEDAVVQIEADNEVSGKTSPRRRGRLKGSTNKNKPSK